MLFGIGPFCRRFSELPTVESHLGAQDAPYRQLQALVQHARLASVLARGIATLRQDREPEESAVAAALFELPALLLFVTAPDVAMALAAARACGVEPEAEVAVLGVSCAELQQPLAVALGLPEILAALIDVAQWERPRVHAVQLAVRLARQLQDGYAVDTQIEELRGSAELLCLPVDELVRSVRHAAHQAAAAMRPGRGTGRPVASRRASMRY
jgi:hypothetical protein